MSPLEESDRKDRVHFHWIIFLNENINLLDLLIFKIYCYEIASQKGSHIKVTTNKGGEHHLAILNQQRQREAQIELALLLQAFEQEAKEASKLQKLSGH